MKNLVPIFFFVVLLYGCNKKDSAAPVETPPTLGGQLDTVSGTTTMSVQRYSGCLFACVSYGTLCGDPTPQYYTEPAFIYDMTNIRDSVLIFRMERPVYSGSYQDSTCLVDTVPVKIINYTLCIKDSIFGCCFKIIGDSLYVSAGVGLGSIPGVSVQFAGKAIRDTAVAKAKPLHH